MESDVEIAGFARCLVRTFARGRKPRVIKRRSGPIDIAPIMAAVEVARAVAFARPARPVPVNMASVYRKSRP
jgi:hypothetical protein